MAKVKVVERMVGDDGFAIAESVDYFPDWRQASVHIQMRVVEHELAGASVAHGISVENNLVYGIFYDCNYRKYCIIEAGDYT